MKQVYVTTCDRYSPIIPMFARCFQQYWPDCDWPVSVVTEEIAPLPLPPGWKLLTGQAREYGHMLKNGLALGAAWNDVILLLLEDHLLCHRPEVELIETAAGLVSDGHASFVRLHDCPGPTLDLDPATAEVLGEQAQYFGQLDPHEPYAMSLRPTVWRMRFLFYALRAAYSPWQTELQGSKHIPFLMRRSLVAWGPDEGRVAPGLCLRLNAVVHKNLVRNEEVRQDIADWYEEQFEEAACREI